MIRAFEEAVMEESQPKANKKPRLPYYDTSALPKDVWGVVLKCLHLYDIIFIRATSSTFYKLCKEYRPFPKYFVLDQDKCMEYLVEKGFISCLDYVKNTLRFEWPQTNALFSIAIRSGQVHMVKFLREKNYVLNPDALCECTAGTCDLSMLKYLHESGVPFAQTFQGKPVRSQPMANMAFHGHLACMKYAMENGYTQHVINYTPSIECLDFAIQHGFDWKGYLLYENICEVAAEHGNLEMLKYAHQHGARLKTSTTLAAKGGHLECLKYAVESTDNTDSPSFAKTLPCFKYLVEKYPQTFKTNPNWIAQFKLGNIEILRFMLNKGFPVPDKPFHSFMVDAAASSAENFKFLLDDLQVLDPSQMSLYLPLIYGDINSLKIALERNLLYDSPELKPNDRADIAEKAIRSKNVKIVELIWEKFQLKLQPKIDPYSSLMFALAQSTPEIFDFLTQQGAIWTSDHLVAVSEYSLPNMAYLTRLGCKWGERACSTKIAMCVKYAREHGCVRFVG